jgi:membrane protein implicated in regulation of membrane protease activity
MGWGKYEEGGLIKVLGAFFIVIGVGLAVYVLWLSRSNWVIASVLFLVFLILGAVMISWGGYSRKQNTPMGRIEDVREK